MLSQYPAHLKKALSAQFLSSLEGDLQAELQAIIQSQPHWSMQTVKLEVAQQQRLKELQSASSKPPRAEFNPQLIVSCLTTPGQAPQPEIR